MEKIMDKIGAYEVVTDDIEVSYNQVEASTPKKRKSKVQEDTAEKPKKPRSAYLLYYFDVHQMTQQELPNLPQSEINKRISESWKRLSVAEKAYYLEKAKFEKEGIDTSPLSPSNDLPGFRKILPRASYVLLSKSCQSEVTVESLDPPAEGGLSSVTQTREPHLTPLELPGEVELSELPIVDEDSAEETVMVSHPTTVQGIPPAPSFSATSKSPVSTDSQFSTDLKSNGVTLKEIQTRGAGSSYSWAMVQHVQREPTQMVAIIPSQSLLEPKTAVNSVCPLMMVSVGAKVEQSAKPSYKMSVKTYTRRGRGRCLNPRCSFVYVTRHKPPTCPECGSQLGGKWIPAAKKTKEKATAASKQFSQKAETKPEESSQPTQLPPQGENADVSKTHNSGSKRQAQTQLCPREQHAVPVKKTPEGRSTKQQEQTKQLKDSLKSTTVQDQDRCNVVVQKRPVRPILPAYYNTGSALLQIITVPPDKGKYQTANTSKSSNAPRESLSGLKPSTLKQLGQTVPTTALKQDFAASADGRHPVSSLTDGRMNVLSMVPFKESTVTKFDLGLSTARGRGRCKNLSCDFMYKNRHKPAVCPKCGCELTQKNAKGAKSETLLDPYQHLSPAQKDIQRQNTLLLLRRSLQIPESETELQETLNLIQELNGLQIILIQPGNQEHEDNVGTETMVESGWPQFYESAASHCGLCNYPLFKGGQR